MKDSDNEMIA